MFGVENVNVNHREFQKGFDTDELRRKRENEKLNLRKQQRKTHLAKRRRALQSVSKNTLNGNGGANGEESKLEETNALINGEQPRIEHLAQYIAMIKSSDPTQQLRATIMLRMLLSHERDPPMGAVCKLGAVPILIKFISDFSNPKLQFEAAWALSNIASGSSGLTKYVVEMGGLKAFASLVDKSNEKDVLDQAIWGLGNICGDCDELREAAYKSGFAVLLIARIPTYDNAILGNALWCLSNLTRCKKRNSKHFPKRELIALLPTLLKFIDKCIANVDNELESSMLQDLLWLFCYLSDSDDETDDLQTAICDLGIPQRCCKMLYSQRLHLSSPALRIIGNLVTGGDDETQKVIDGGAIDGLTEIITSATPPNQKKEACWALSNIAASCSEHFDLILRQDSNLFDHIVRLVEEAPNVVRKEAGWVISNGCATASAVQISKIVENGVIKAMYSLLLTARNDQMVAMIVETFGSILEKWPKSQSFENKYGYQMEEMGVLDRLEEIQAMDHISESTYKMIVALLNKYWPNDDNLIDDAQIQMMKPQTDGNQFLFGGNGGASLAEPSPFTF